MNLANMFRWNIYARFLITFQLFFQNQTQTYQIQIFNRFITIAPVV